MLGDAELLLLLHDGVGLGLGRRLLLLDSLNGPAARGRVELTGRVDDVRRRLEAAKEDRALCPDRRRLLPHTAVLAGGLGVEAVDGSGSRPVRDRQEKEEAERRDDGRSDALPLLRREAEVRVARMPPAVGRRVRRELMLEQDLGHG